MPMMYIGELAALSTSLLWAFTSILFSEAGKKIGSFRVNKIRLVFAVIIYATVLLATTGSLFYEEINQQQVFWLGLSGFVGLVFGDGCGFKALVMIGPRLTTLLYATTPIMTTIIAWFFLGEKLSIVDSIAIFLTVAGIIWVVTERSYTSTVSKAVSDNHPDHGSLVRGVILGIGAALGQAVGLVLAKKGMTYAGGEVPPMEASFIRMLVAVGGIWIIAIFRGEAITTLRSMKQSKAMIYTAGGTIVGPFLGVWMSLVAIKMIPTGIASTLNSMTPVMILPLVIWYYREKVSPRALFGAVVAVIGVTLLFLY